MIKMKDKLLFINTYKSKRSNGVNRAYWAKVVKNIPNIGKFLSTNTIEPYDERMPIFSCLVKNMKRGIVIYQYNPLLIPQGETFYEKYITAWTSQRKLDRDRISILTICLIPSKKNMETSKILIKAWFEKKKNIRRLIANIYELQENPINNIELYDK